MLAEKNAVRPVFTLRLGPLFGQDVSQVLCNTSRMFTLKWRFSYLAFFKVAPQVFIPVQLPLPTHHHDGEIGKMFLLLSIPLEHVVECCPWVIASMNLGDSSLEKFFQQALWKNSSCLDFSSSSFFVWWQVLVDGLKVVPIGIIGWLASVIV